MMYRAYPVGQGWHQVVGLLNRWSIAFFASWMIKSPACGSITHRLAAQSKWWVSNRTTGTTGPIFTREGCYATGVLPAPAPVAGTPTMFCLSVNQNLRSCLYPNSRAARERLAWRVDHSARAEDLHRVSVCIALARLDRQHRLLPTGLGVATNDVLVDVDSRDSRSHGYRLRNASKTRLDVACPAATISRPPRIYP